MTTPNPSAMPTQTDVSITMPTSVTPAPAPNAAGGPFRAAAPAPGPAPAPAAPTPTGSASESGATPLPVVVTNWKTGDASATGAAAQSSGSGAVGTAATSRTGQPIAGGGGSGPAADKPPQQVSEEEADHAHDDDLWQGGLINYEDPSRSVLPRKLLGQRFRERWFGFADFRKPQIWQAAIIEFVGTTLWVLYLCAGAVAFARTDYSALGVFWYSLLVALLLPLLVFSTTVASGGHLNPIITLATFFAGFTKLSRALLYLIAQFAGGIFAAALLWGWLGETERALYGAGNCNAGALSQSRALLVETVSNFMWVFVVFGVALDPAQRVVFGPVLGPIFLSFVLGIIVFFTGLSGNYGGAWCHPARCFGAAVVSGRFSMEVWVSIVAWVLAALLMGGLYLLVPFNHEMRTARRKEKRVRRQASLSLLVAQHRAALERRASLSTGTTVHDHDTHTCTTSASTPAATPQAKVDGNLMQRRPPV